MAELLLELFSEEIPARMQAQAAKDLERLVVGALSDRGLLFEGSKAFAGPRRLTLVASGLPVKQPDVSEEKKGPRVGAPEKAMDGFLRNAGVTLDQCEKRSDGKGEFYVAVIHRKGRATSEVLSEILPECFAKLPWPKSMRWIPGEAVRWVRPLHSILAVFDGAVVPFEFAGVKSGSTTKGHRFLSAGVINAKSFEIYRHDLRNAHVMLDAAERKETILTDAKNKAFALGLELIEDQGLLDEVAGLNEWPTVLIGTIEDQFMDVPAEILQTSMRVHQKYFSLRDPSTGKMASRFAVVSNMVAEDGGKAIVAGNERVLRARLSDAKFFWDQDRQHRLDSRVEKLKGIVFHAKLGTQYERVERIEALAGEIAEKIGADVEKAKRAALLCKADLTTGVVGEFPELQGVMGRYYALHDHEDAEVADAIRDHYRPVGPSDAVPTSKVSIAVALADKLDQLTCFFGVGEKPTGSGDPFALRRAALGLIRIILEDDLRLRLRDLTMFSLNSAVAGSMDVIDLFDAARFSAGEVEAWVTREELQQVTNSFSFWVLDPSNEFRTKTRDKRGDKVVLRADEWGNFISPYFEYLGLELGIGPNAEKDDLELESETKIRHASVEWFRSALLAVADSLRGFFADRLKVALKEKGTRYDLIDAVFSLGNEDDLVRLVARVEALQTFLKSEEGADLLAGYKRAANILKAEEKKDKTTFDGSPDPDALVLDEEKSLYVELSTAADLVKAEIERECFVEAMGVMSRLRGPVDAFFDKVTVNDRDPALRKNRLLLLSRLRATLHLAADFSKIEG